MIPARALSLAGSIALAATAWLASWPAGAAVDSWSQIGPFGGRCPLSSSILTMAR
jgi:hypothetical protein